MTQGAATVADYVHNAMGQRVAKTVGSATTHFLYDLTGRIIGEADGATGAATAEYIWLEGMPLAFVTGGAVYYIHADHLGTPQRLTDATKAVVWDASYAPFGAATVSGPLTFNLRFPGQYEDAETGLHYNYFRDYDPALGRYVQSDPIGLGGGWNTYAYVGGRPVMRVDVFGLQVLCASEPPQKGKKGPCAFLKKAKGKLKIVYLICRVLLTDPSNPESGPPEAPPPPPRPKNPPIGGEPPPEPPEPPWDFPDLPDPPKK